MMDDLIKKLRDIDHNWHEAACSEAADEIERLRAREAELVELVEILSESITAAQAAIDKVEADKLDGEEYWRNRAAAHLDERAKIVAWGRLMWPAQEYGEDYVVVRLLNRVEAGEHLK